ncbi:hypothetical protein [Altericista sp. CCNU0014]|uniref:hypothetical protein n=1 Tax=Altericista sp. CCNU0014 TaxID=3082949 RepID=UPI00384E9CD0
MIYSNPIAILPNFIHRQQIALTAEADRFSQPNGDRQLASALALLQGTDKSRKPSLNQC